MVMIKKQESGDRSIAAEWPCLIAPSTTRKRDGSVAGSRNGVTWDVIHGMSLRESDARFMDLTEMGD